jgi:hypothetical protein
MFLQNYFLYADRVELLMTEGSIHSIYFNANSGQVYYRYKIGTISDVKHPGIYLGRDIWGNNHYMHNHYQTGKPAIVIESEFTQAQPLYLYEESPINTPMQIIENGLQQVLNGEPYKWLNYNCQSFVNRASQNKNKSEAVEKWAGGIFVTLLVIFGVKAFSNSK